MLPKDVDWSVLAQCDIFAVEKYVQTPDRIAMRTVKPMRKTIFQNKLATEEKWRAAYQTVCDVYERLPPNFLICHDSFGGYRLVYKGKKAIRSSDVLKQNPIGFVREIPDGVVTDLSVMSSVRSGKQLILLGPVRFVNSDCDPNCEYDFSSEFGVVQLRAKKRINPGEELLVKYGPDFFEFNSCCCRTCQVRSKEELSLDIVFDLLLLEVLSDLTSVVVEKMLFELQESNDCGAKKRRIKGRELVEVFNELCESPPSPTVQNEEFLDISNNQPYVSFSRMYESTASLDHPETDEPLENSDCSSEEEQVNSELTSANQESDHETSVDPQSTRAIVRASSPLLDNEAINFLNFSLSAIEDNFSEETDLETECPVQLSDKLFDQTETTVDEATALTDLFCSRFKLSDECTDSLHTLIRSLLPAKNKFPSGYSHNKRLKSQFEDNLRVMQKSTNGSLCVMSFRFQLRDIFKQNVNEILRYSEFRKSNPSYDFNQSFCPRVLAKDKNIILNLVMFSDGVNIKKSTFKKELWPVWIQLADLPPKLHMARKNIVLAALFAGGTFPDWATVVPHIRDEICSAIQVEINEEVSFNLTFKVRLLISDLGAKNHMLNMLKFNGYYGCHYCTVKGETIGRTHAYYPYNQRGSIREPSLNDVYVNIAETLSLSKIPNVVGVKGRSCFSSIIDGLPLTAPVDYMHCVLIGVFPELLKLCYKTLSALNREQISQIVANLACPREMISYSRKIRSLDEVSQFKANEYFNWLFYVSPLVFLGRLPHDLYMHLTNLSLGIRLLLESNLESSVRASEILLDRFCREIVTVHGGNKRIETINVHCLRHLADQVRRFGPLFCQSAMSFESANRSLGEVFTGANSECEVICRRLLQRHKLHSVNLQNEDLTSLLYKLTGKPIKDCATFCSELIETEAIEKGGHLYKTAKFLNRVFVNGRYFDSPAYGRSKCGNCYVSFKDGENNEIFGKIQYFLEIPESPFDNKTLANISIFTILEEIGSEKKFFFRVTQTPVEKLVPV